MLPTAMFAAMTEENIQKAEFPCREHKNVESSGNLLNNLCFCDIEP